MKPSENVWNVKIDVFTRKNDKGLFLFRLLVTTNDGKTLCDVVSKKEYSTDSECINEADAAAASIAKKFNARIVGRGYAQ